ncbi:transposase family protein, partial [Dactylosporangium sp. NPDC005572]|uniref:transposase family protein n=1 Tax=Dactylosporangium sp. NPDC005572 TaxID=3156889 RepID=UPI0033B7FD35
MEFAAAVLPHLASVRLQRVRLAGVAVRLEAATTSRQAICPTCGSSSDRAHSRYIRRLTDTAIGGREVRLDLTVRRYFCQQVTCARKTFVEQVPQVTSRYGRHTQLAAQLVQAVALALGGRPGSRLAGRL